jgi:undecaprenyl-diphosphatase
MNEPAHPDAVANDAPRGAVARFDRAVDDAFERWRGRPQPDRFFAGATRFGEFSIGWQVVSVVAALVTRRPGEAVRTAALIGAESLLVNQGIKRVFLRQRPVSDAPEEHGVRRPVTSSFPSGHASSAFFAAVLLTRRHPRLAPLWFVTAAVVATSRPYLRLHHASDVVGGAVTGLAVAALAERFVPHPR